MAQEALAPTATAARLLTWVHPLSSEHTNPRTYHQYEALVEEVVERFLTASQRAPRVVAIGDGSHGTAEFFEQRNVLTALLIEAFQNRLGPSGSPILAIEWDFPDVTLLNEYILGHRGDLHDLFAELATRRFPHAMWTHEPMRDFVQFLRDHNAANSGGGGGGAELPPVQMFGLDLYSEEASAHAVPRLLRSARMSRLADQTEAEYKRCVFALETDDYAGEEQDCENTTRNAVRAIASLQERDGYSRPRLSPAEEALFNADIVHGMVRYRGLPPGDAEQWNLRDQHFASVIIDRLSKRFPGRPIIVWAHLSHVWDAAGCKRMSEDMGQTNLGEQLRERLGADQVFLIGMMTHRGTVIAAEEWGAPSLPMTVLPAVHGSFEEFLHRVFLLLARPGVDGFWIDLREPSVQSMLRRAFPPHGQALQRAIGAVYVPDTELDSHYLEATLAQEFDALIFLDRTHAVRLFPRPARLRTLR